MLIITTHSISMNLVILLTFIANYFYISTSLSTDSNSKPHSHDMTTIFLNYSLSSYALQ